MAKTRYDKAWEILGSALSDQNASVYQMQREREEEEARRLEEARKKANFDNAQGTPQPKSLDSMPVEDDGYSIWDVGVMARQGANSLVKGLVGLPTDIANLVATPNPDEFVPSPFKDDQSMAFQPMQQPEAVRGIRSEIDRAGQKIYDQQASAKLKAKDKEFQAADGLWGTTKFLATNPGYFGLQGMQQAPQLLGGGAGPGVTGKIIAGGLSAASQAEEATTKALREQGFSEQEIAERGANAFGTSLALNVATPLALKATLFEGALSSAAGKRVTDGIFKEVLGQTSREVAEGIVTETGDQLIQNLASGKPWDEGLAQSATLGAAFSAAVAGPTATIQSAAEAGKAASNLQAYLTNQENLARRTQPPATREPVQEDMFGGRREIPIEPLSTAPGNVGTDTEGVQARLRSQADMVRAQLEADRERLAGFQTRIERAPFAEDQADLLTNQERTDMSRIQERVAAQEKLLAELEAQQTPTQLGLNLQGKNQPKNPKFTGQERTVDQIKSDYFKTQPVQGPQNMTPAQRKAVQKDITEELKRTKAEQKKANDKIKAARAAARRKFLDGQRAGLLDLPVEERAKRLAEAGREWDTANPLVLPTAPVATKPAAAPAEAQEAEASVPVSTLTEGLQGTPQGTVPLPSTAQAPAQGTTLEDVRKAVGGGKRDKLASRMSYMVEDGNLEIVESQDQIPGDIGEMIVQGKGWYDPNTGKTYLVASNLDSNNTRGDILATLAHETKHGGDFGGSKGLARSFKPFIGSKANKEMVEKIKKAAKAGDTSAKFALRAVLGDEQNQDNKTVYQELDHTEDQVNSEIVANYLTAEHKKSGVKTSLYRGIVSPLRVGAKKLLGSNDVSLGDIHYMADRLVNEVAQRGERMKPSNGNALPMTISGGRTEAEQIRNNRTWLSADGKRKYEISDKDSSVEIPGDYMDRDFKAKEILKHDKLYNERPELADTTIRFAELDPSTGGQYSKEDNVITINTATNEFKRGRNMYNGLIHQYILHEMQHRAQGVSGTTPGASPTYFLPNEAKRLENDIEDLAFAINYGKSTGADADFLERQRQEMSQKEQEYLQKYGPNTPAYEAATIQYEKVLGELEAYRTNNNLTKTEAELDETGLGQQEVQWDKEEGITTETGKRIRPTTKPKVSAMPSVSESGSAPSKPRYKTNGKDTVYEWERNRAIEREYEEAKRAERRARIDRQIEDEQLADASRRSFLKKAAGVAVTAAVAGGARLNNTNITLGRAKPVSEAVLYSNVSPETKTLLENGDLKGALLEMANNGPKELRWLSRTLSQLLPKGTVAVIDPYTNSNAHGETYMGKDGVEIKLFTADGLRGMSHGTILHEVLHAVVMGRYRSLSSGLDHNYKLLGLTKPQALKAMDDFRSLWHEFRDEVNLSGITEEGDSPSLSEAMASPDEFFVRALTDPRLKAIMSKMAYSRGGSIYSRFKNWVKHTLFGSSGQKPSWLDAALMSTEDLLSAMGKDEADFKFINAFDKEIESSKVHKEKATKAKPMPSVSDDFQERRQAQVDAPKVKAYRDNLMSGIASDAKAMQEKVNNTDYAHDVGDTVILTNGPRATILEKMFVADWGNFPEGATFSEKSRITKSRPKIPGYRVRQEGRDEDGEPTWMEFDLPERAIKAKAGIQRKPRAAPMPSVAEQSENDNRNWWNKMKDSSAALRVVSHLLSTTEGLDGELFKLFTNRQGNRADLALRAQEAGSHAENSLRKAAEVSGKSLKQVTREVKSQLSEINKMPNRSDREAAVKALDKNYPGLGTAMTNLRNLKWSLSRAVIEQRIKQGEDLSAKENATHEAIIKNAETYITRAYMSNQLPGKKFAKRRLSDIKKNPQGEEAIQYDRAVQFLMDRHLVIPTSEELATKSDTAIRALYENWIGDSSGVEVADMAKALDTLPRKSAEAYRAEAEKIAKEVMGINRPKSNVTTSYQGARQNRTILEGRENVPAEIRFLMGEIVNPVAAELMTIARLSSLYTQTKMLEGMVEGGKDKWYKTHKEGDFNTLLKDDSYGPMKGKWVTPTAAKFLEPAVELGASIEQVLNPANKDLGRMVAMTATAGIRAMRSTTSVVKLADLVTSPVAMAWNYIGAYQIAMQNGVFNPIDWAKAQGATRRAIEAHKNPSKFTKEQLEESQELVRVGVLDSATVGEFQQSFFDSMFRLLEDEQDINAFRVKAERLVKDGVIDAKDLYAFMDMWAKVAAYYDRKGYLTKFNAAEGGKLSQDQVNRKAGFEITASNISYTRAVKAIKLAEQNLPAFTMYLTYFSEVPRSLVASSFLAVKDLKQAANAKTAKGRNLALSAGLRRAAGTLMSTAVLSTLVTMYLNSLDEDEKRRRKTDPEWEAKGVPIKIGEDKDGKPLFINLLRADANGPWNEFVVNMSTLEEDEDIGDALMKTLKSQFVEAKPIKDTFRLIRGLAGKETYNNDDGFGDFADSLDDMSWGKDENLGRNFMSVLEGFTPKIIKGSYRSANGTIGKRKHEFNPSENLRAAAFQAAGGTLYVRDPEFSLEIATGAYKKQKSEAAKELNGMKGKLGRMDGKALIDKLSDVVEDERKAYQSLWEVYDGTKAFNGYYTDKDYTKAAKKILTAEELGPAEDDVVNGAFNVRFISKDYINAWRDARIEKIKEMEPNKKSKAMAQLRQDYKMVADYLGTRE